MPRRTIAELEALLAAERAARESAEGARAEAQEQQTATAEVLRVIAASPADLQRVLDAICATAARLLNTENVGIMRGTAEGMRLAAGRGPAMAATQAAYRDQPLFPVRRGSINGRAFLDRRTQRVADVRELLDGEFPDARETSERFGMRSYLVVPLLRQGEAIGTLAAFRTEVLPFTEAQASLLETI